MLSSAVLAKGARKESQLSSHKDAMLASPPALFNVHCDRSCCHVSSSVDSLLQNWKSPSQLPDGRDAAFRVSRVGATSKPLKKSMPAALSGSRHAKQDAARDCERRDGNASRPLATRPPCKDSRESVLVSPGSGSLGLREVSSRGEIARRFRANFARLATLFTRQTLRAGSPSRVRRP